MFILVLSTKYIILKHIKICIENHMINPNTEISQLIGQEPEGRWQVVLGTFVLYGNSML